MSNISLFKSSDYYDDDDDESVSDGEIDKDSE